MKLVGYAPFVPYKGIDHAGGDYLYEYYRAAHLIGWTVTLIAPATERNIGAAREAPAWLRIVLCVPEIRSPRVVRFARIVTTGNAWLMGMRWWSRLPQEARSELLTADILDLQWTEGIVHAPLLSQKAPCAFIVGTAHDVAAQGLRRTLKNGAIRERVRARLALPAMTRTEAKSLSACDSVYVFKAEDIELLRSLGVSAEIDITTPVIRLPPKPIEPSINSRRVVFVGAMWRTENAESVAWFLSEVWPRILSAVPDAQFRVAGSGPPEWLVALSSRSVEVTGYLADMSSAYEEACLAVAPLTRGAGLKFKVIQAIALGFPVVGTSIADEGVAHALGDSPVRVADDAEGFASSVIDVLTSPASHADFAKEHARRALDRLDYETNLRVQLASYPSRRNPEL